MIKVWVDGLAKGNHLRGKGEAAVGIVINLMSGQVVFPTSASYSIKEPLTNNEAEYVALLLAAREINILKLADEGDDIFVFSDSALAVNQMNKTWKTKDKKFIPIQEAIRELFNGYNVFYVWINREQNKEADRLANEANKDSRSKVYSVREYFGSN